MKHLALRFVVSLLTFSIGVSSSYVRPVNIRPVQQATETKKGLEITPLGCAVKVARSMGDSGSYTLAEIAVRYAQIGEFNKAIQLVDTVEDREERIVGLLKIAVRYWKKGKTDLAGKTFGEIAQIPSASFHQYTLGQIAEQYAAAKQYEQVFDIAATKMEDDYHASVALEAIVDNVNAHGNEDELNILAEVIKRVEKLSEKSRILTKIAVKYAEGGRYDRALPLAESMADNEDNFDRDDTLHEIALILAKDGQFDRAIKLARRTDDYFKEETVTELAGRLIEVGQVDKALSLLPEVLRSLLSGIDENDIPGYIAERVADVAVRYAQAGKKEKAVETLSKALALAKATRKNVERDEALHKVAVSYSKIGLFDQAIEVAQSNNYQYGKVEALADVGAEMVKAGQDNKVMQVMLMIQDAALTDREEMKANGMMTIADAYLKAGRKDMAMSVLSIGFEIARSAKVNDFQPTTMEHLAEKYAEMGEYEKAFEVVLATTEPFHRAHALMDIGVSHAKSEQVLSVKSKELLSEIGASTP